MGPYFAQAEYAYNDSPNRSTGQSPFHIFYGMHPRGILESRNLGRAELRSADGEEFSLEIQAIYEQVKQQLQGSSIIDKSRADLSRKEFHFEVGDLVLAHLRKERFPRNKYNKLKFKNIGPCKILRKFSANAYEIELPLDVGISPIFNVADLYKYEDGGAEERSADKGQIEWKEQRPPAQPLQP